LRSQGAPVILRVPLTDLVWVEARLSVDARRPLDVDSAGFAADGPARDGGG